MIVTLLACLCECICMRIFGVWVYAFEHCYLNHDVNNYSLGRSCLLFCLHVFGVRIRANVCAQYMCALIDRQFVEICASASILILRSSVCRWFNQTFNQGYWCCWNCLIWNVDFWNDFWNDNLVWLFESDALATREILLYSFRSVRNVNFRIASVSQEVDTEMVWDDVDHWPVRLISVALQQCSIFTRLIDSASFCGNASSTGVNHHWSWREPTRPNSIHLSTSVTLMLSV